MKKILLMTLMALTIAGVFAKTTTKNPKGLYRLSEFIYEGGRTAPPGFYQYKYAADSVGLLISYNPSPTTTQWSRMQVEIREPYPLLNTGEVPQDPDGHGTQVFNVDDNQFLFKWYNDRWPRMSNLNEFIIEVYRNTNMAPEVVQAFNMLENKIEKTNRFSGWWIRVGATADPNGTGKRQPVPTMWKAYSKGLSMVVNVAANGKVLACNPTSTIKYENDSTIWEIGHPCNIHWLNDDCHALTFTQENGVPLTEIWVRAGLPKEWQRIFNTNLETYRNGVDCITDAVVEATQKDNLEKANAFIAEATERDVPIASLGEGTMGIAMYLLMVKQQYQACADFCSRQLQVIKDYAADGHDHTMISKLHLHMVEVCHAIATYRSGEKEKGMQMIENQLSVADSEIERYKTVKGMESYINLLYYHNLMMHYLGYDILGAERTLLYLDALMLMAPNMAAQNRLLILNCRGNCYLLSGDKDSARKLWQQIKDIHPDHFKNDRYSNPLKQEFGE